MCCGDHFFDPDFTSRMFFCFSYTLPIPAPAAANFSPTRRRPLPEGQARASILIAARAQASAHVFAHSFRGLGDGGPAPWPPRDGSRRPLHLRARACAGKGVIFFGAFFSARVASRAPPDLISVGPVEHVWPLGAVGAVERKMFAPLRLELRIEWRCCSSAPPI